MRIEIEIGTMVLQDVPAELAVGLRELVEQRLTDRARGLLPADFPTSRDAHVTGPDDLADLISAQVWDRAGLDRHVVGAKAGHTPTSARPTSAHLTDAGPVRAGPTSTRGVAP